MLTLFTLQTCGLEIVAAQSTEYKSENSTYVSYQKDPRWSQFIHSLTESGYFREEIEGSQLHIKLMSSAKDFFVSMLEREKGDGDGSVRSKGAAIHRIIRDVPCAADTYRAEESTLPPADGNYACVLFRLPVYVHILSQSRSSYALGVHSTCVYLCVNDSGGILCCYMLVSEYL